MPSGKCLENEISGRERWKGWELKKIKPFIFSENSTDLAPGWWQYKFPPAAPIEVLDLKELCTAQRVVCNKLVKPSAPWWAYEKDLWGVLVRQGWAPGASCSVAWTTWFIWRIQRRSPQMKHTHAVSQAWPGVGLLAIPTCHLSMTGTRTPQTGWTLQPMFDLFAVVVKNNQLQS